MRLCFMLLSILKIFFDAQIVASIGTPERSRLFNDHSDAVSINHFHDDDLHDLHAAFPPIPAFEHAIQPSHTMSNNRIDKSEKGNKKRKSTRELRQDPANRKRRMKYNEDKERQSVHNGGNVLLQQQKQKANEIKEHKRIQFNFQRAEKRRREKEILHLPGNEEKLRKHKEQVAKYNKNYITKLDQELREGTISEGRKKSFERRRQVKNILRNTINLTTVTCTRPGSPDWNQILADPIVENLSPSSSGEHGRSFSFEISKDEFSRSTERGIKNSSVQPSSHLTAKDIKIQSTNSDHEEDQWFSRKKLSMKPRAIAERKRLAKMKEERYDEYLARKAKKTNEQRIKNQNLTPEQQLKKKEYIAFAQRRYYERQRRASLLPLNAENDNTVSKQRIKSITLNQARKNLVAMIKSGTATAEQIRKYNHSKMIKAESARRSYHRNKAKKAAINNTKHTPSSA